MNPLVRTSLYCGLGAGVFYVLYFIALYALSVPLFDTLYSLDFIIGMVFVGSGLYFFRHMVNGNALRFWQGLILSIMSVFVAATLLGSFIYLFLNFIDPEFLTKSVNFSIVELESYRPQMIEDYGQAAAEAKIERMTAGMQAMTAGHVAAGKLFWSVIGSFFYGTLLSVIFRK